MNDYDRDRMRSLRGGIGWLLVFVWIVFWWLHLDAVKRAALAVGCPPTFFGGINDAIFGRGASCRGQADSQFFNHMFWVIVVSPLGFWIANPLAKLWIYAANAYEAYQYERQETERQQAHINANQRAIALITQKSEHQEQQTRKVNERYELITRLGAVDDQLIVLAAEKDAERVPLIHLNISQGIRDINAQFTKEQLRALSVSDATIAARVARTLAEMDRTGLAQSRFYADLHGLFVDDA